MSNDNQPVAFLTYTIGTTDLDKSVYFDVVLTERHGFENDITEFAVEDGANITDHVRPNPLTVTLEVVKSNEPISDDPEHNLGAIIGSIPISPPVFTPPLNLNPFALTSAAEAGIGGLISPPAPTPTAVAVLQMPSASADIPSDTMAELIILRNTATLINLTTRWGTFPDMVIEKLETDRDKDTGLAMKATITFRKLRIVNTQTVTAPAIPRAKPTVSKGQRTGVTTVNQRQATIAKSLLDLHGN